MSNFNGFPPGELKFTSVPDLFFARLLPQIDDLVELKVTLHILWLRQRDNKQAISLAELQSDETLIHGLSIIDEEPFAALTQGLTMAVQRNSILHARIEDEEGEHDLYFLNSEGGRIALEKMQTGETGVVAVTGRISPRPISRSAPTSSNYTKRISAYSPPFWPTN